MNTINQLSVSVFSSADQDWFAEISGDYNPMHVDPVAARRTQAGAPVVHGMHSLLWALDAYLKIYPLAFTTLSARFERFIYVDEEVQAIVSTSSAEKVTLELQTDGSKAATITLGFTSADAPQSLNSKVKARKIGLPRLHSLDAFAELSGAFFLVDARAKLETRFPSLAHAIGPDVICSLAGFSTLVGMECPGQLSIFSKFSARVDGSRRDGSTLHYTVRRFQPQLRALKIDLEAPFLTGSVDAFIRQPPTTQPNCTFLRQKIHADFAKGDQVLIVGGSRGLGELTAKIAAMGGAEVTITYARGAIEAQSIANEIVAAGGSCRAIPLDVLKPLNQQLLSAPSRFTHCYYFATPPIFRKRGLDYDRKAVDNFMTFYVDVFRALVRVLAERNPSIIVFTPSSSAIDERPKGSLEYVIAKAAAEYLVADLPRYFPMAQIVTTRFSRVLTDQTATVLPVDNADPLKLLLPIMRDLHQKEG